MKKLLLALALLVSFGHAQTNSSTVVITASGGTKTIVNSVGGLIANFEEIPSGSPATVSVTVQGCMRGGTCDAAADTNTSTSAANRGVTFTKAYNYFLITASWTGGTNPTITVNYLVTTAQNGGGGGGGAVSSVFGRVGAVSANANDYNFNQLAGNIAVTQMNSGTNADVNHFWRGDNTWSTIAAVLPCSVTPNSLQYNNGGAFGCVTQWTTDATTLTASATGALDLSAAPVLTGLKIPAAAGAVPTVDGRLAENTTNHTIVWGSNGTTVVGAAAATGVGVATTCSNQFITAVSGIAIPTCTTAVLASAQFANQGGTNVVLHGNAAGNPAFSSVTSSDVDSSISKTASRIDQNNASTTSAQLATTLSDELTTGGSAKVVYAVTLSGNGTALATTTGALTSQDCVKIDANGNFVDAGAGCGGSSTVQNASQYSAAYYSAAGTANTISGVAAPTTPTSVPQVLVSIPGGAATAPVWQLTGVGGRTVAGASDTIVVADRASWVIYSSASSTAVTLPQAGSAGFTSNFVVGVKATGAGDVTVTPTTSTVDGNATIVVKQGQNCTITSFDNANYVSRCATGQSTPTAPITFTASANGGAFGCATCIVASSPAVGILHVAGSTQTATSSAVDLSGADATGIMAAARMPALTGDVQNTSGTLATTVFAVHGVTYGATPGTNTVPVVTSSNTVTYEAVPNAALANSATTVNGQTCTLGSTCNVNSGAATNSVALNQGNGAVMTGVGPGTTNQVLTATTSAAPTYKSFGDLTTTDYVAGGGTAQAQTVTLVPAVTALTTGLHVRWKPSNANSGAAPTLSTNGTTATNITKCGTTALAASDLTTTAIAEVTYDGTQYQLLNPQAAGCGSGAAGVTSFTGTGVVTNSASTGAVSMTVAGTSGGLVYFSAASTWASSAALGANQLVFGGGGGVAPATVAGLASDGTSVFVAGVAGTSVGGLDLKNATSGTISLRPVTGALGAVTVSFPAATGTVAVSATSPITESAAGAVGCATCVTSSGGGVITATAPVTASAAGLIAITGAAGQVLAGAGPAFTATPVLGVAGSTVGTLGFQNATSGTITLSAPTGALGTPTNTFQAVSDTFVYKSTTDVLSNKSLSIDQVKSAGGAITALANGNNPLVINCALTSGTTCLTTGETTAATTAGAVEYQITTLTTTTAIPLKITQGAAGPANAAAPDLINISAAAAGGAAGASNAGSNGAAITLLTGAGSAGGATTGVGGVGGAVTITQGVGGAAGGTATNNGGNGGGVAWTTGAGGNGGSGAATAGSGGGFTVTLGAPGTNSATGTAGAVGQFNVTGNAPASTANAAGAAAGTVFKVTGIAGGASSNTTGTAGIGSVVSINGGIGGGGTGTNAVGGAGGTVNLLAGNGGASLGTGANANGGDILLTPGAAGSGGSGTAGKQGTVQVLGSTAGFVYFAQGSTNTTANADVPATSIIEQAPTAVTAYTLTKPGAAPVIASIKTTDACASAICTESFKPAPVVLTTTADFTTAANTSLQTITGLSLTAPVSKAVVIAFHCAYNYSQATAAVAVAFGIQGATTAPTRIEANGTNYTSATAATTGTLDNLTTTTATNIVSVAPSAITTIWKGIVDGVAELPSNASPTVLNFMVSTATSGDAVTIKRGSYCKLDYQ